MSAYPLPDHVLESLQHLLGKLSEHEQDICIGGSPLTAGGGHPIAPYGCRCGNNIAGFRVLDLYSVRKAGEVTV